MMSFIFSGVLFWIGVVIAKKLEFYVKARITEMRMIQDEIDKNKEYDDWKKYRLPYLKNKMKGYGNYDDPFESNKNLPEELKRPWDNYKRDPSQDPFYVMPKTIAPGYARVDSSFSGNPTWALAE